MRGIGSSQLPQLPLAVIGTLALMLAASACHSQRGDVANGVVSTSSATVISQEELDHATYSTVYDAIAHMRPQMLRQRGVNTINGHNTDTPSVFLDNRFLGALEQLRHIAPATIGRIEFFSPAEAQFRWGFGHPAGVILLTSRVSSAPPLLE